MSDCVTQPAGRRRSFWATQPSPCGTSSDCESDCGRPGLLKQFPADDCPGAEFSGCGSNPYMELCPQSLCADPVTISTKNWVTGLILNMLMTDARRTDTACGQNPGAINGHWSESFMREQQKIGTSIRYIDAKNNADMIKELKLQAQITMQKLIAYGVARKVDVEARYLGRSTFALDIVAYGQSGVVGRVSVSGARLENAFHWETQDGM